MSERGELERKLLGRHKVIAGVDEVGRGCLAGPVYAAAVIIDYNKVEALLPKTRLYLRDSKKLTPKRRHEMALLIKSELAASFGISFATAREIEAQGIVEATFLAMRRAISKLAHKVDMLLVDGNRPLTSYSDPQACCIEGDNLCYCIAAASIIAKEERDSFMKQKALEYPGYGFEKHVGYGTKQHLDALKTIGICDMHRNNFAPISKTLSSRIMSRIASQ